MNTKRWFMATIAAWVVICLLDFLVHHILLSSLYEQTAFVWRMKSEADSMMRIMAVGTLLFVLALAWFYTKGYEEQKPGLGQGIRFGIYVGILPVAAQNFVWYVVLPVPFILNLAWLASAFIDSVAGGLVIGLIYRN